MSGAETIAELEARLAAHPATPTQSRERVDAMVELAWELGLSDTRRNRELSSSAHEIAEALGYDRGRAYAERNLAYIDMFDGKLEQATTRVLRAKDAFEALDEASGLATAHDTLTNAYLRLGALDQALEHAVRTLELVERLGDQRGIGWAHHNLGQIHRELGELPAARQSYGESLSCFEAIGHAPGQGRVVGLLADIDADEGALDRAIERYHEGIALWDRAEHALGSGMARVRLATLYLRQGKEDEARRHARDAEPLLERIEGAEFHVELELLRCRIERLDGQIEPAERKLLALVERAAAIASNRVELDALSELVDLYEQRGDPHRALETLRQRVARADRRAHEETRARVRNMQVSMGIAAAEREAEVVERLLLNTLPRSIVRELRLRGRVTPMNHAHVTVLFTDFVGFTQVAEQLDPAALVSELDRLFSGFDAICARYRLEKLKTIGDAYMAAAGIPTPSPAHAIAATLAALEIRALVRADAAGQRARGIPAWRIRIGLASGPLVAGVIGRDKFAYDVWGDTVNTASRMESSGEPDHINVSGPMHALLAPYFDCVPRGAIQAKNKGEIEMYFVERVSPAFADPEHGGPGAELRALLEGRPEPEGARTPSG